MEIRRLAQALAVVWLLSASVVIAAEPSAEMVKQYGCISEPRDYRTGYWSKGDPSEVFWCKREAKKNPNRMANERVPPEEMENLLVVVNRDPKRKLACPRAIPMVNEPLKLRLQRNKRIALDHFWSVATPPKSGPKGKVTTGPVIDTGDDSAGHVWYCHGDQWLVLFYH